MGTIIIVTLLAGGLTYFLTRKEGGRWFLASIAAVVGSMLGVILSFAIAQQMSPSIFVKESTVELVSFRDGKGFHGEFWLGSGTVGSVEYYAFYRREKDGGFTREVVSPDKNTSVVLYEEQERKNGEMITEVQTLQPPYDSFFVLDSSRKKKIHRIYVPKGTILREFSTK